MAKLTDEVKTFIVQRLACYDTPSHVAAAVKEEFGLIVSRQQVQEYDPTKRGKAPAKRWVALFESTRERFKDTIDEIPIAHTAVRLRRLDRMAVKAEDKGNFPLAAALMKQAAEDYGGVYTNRRELTGKDGKPLMPDRSLEDLTEAELAALAAKLAAEVADGATS